MKISTSGTKNRTPRIALFVDRLTQGGVQHSFLGLAQAFLDRGLEVDLIVGDRKGRHDHPIPKGARQHVLHDGGTGALAINALREDWRAIVDWHGRPARDLPLRQRSYLPGLGSYLASKAPDAMLSAKTLGNLTAIIARQRAGVATRLVISERGHVSESIRRSGERWKRRKLPPDRCSRPAQEAHSSRRSGLTDLCQAMRSPCRTTGCGPPFARVRRCS